MTPGEQIYFEDVMAYASAGNRYAVNWLLAVWMPIREEIKSAAREQSGKVIEALEN